MGLNSGVWAIAIFYFSFLAENVWSVLFTFIIQPENEIVFSALYFSAEKGKSFYGRPLVNNVRKFVQCLFE